MTSELWLIAAAPGSNTDLPKKNLSIRLDLHLAISLESMADALSKTPSRLAAEILSAGICDFSAKLAELRPDLVGLDEQALYHGVPPDQAAFHRWISPGEAQGELRRNARNPAKDESDLER